MTERANEANDQAHDAAAYAASLMHHYGFDLGGATVGQLLLVWQERYSEAWIRLATIEALYQGRYKAISVEQILALWQRRKQPMYHFNHEFERLISNRLPQIPAPTELSAEEKVFSTRAAQAIVAQLPYPNLALVHPYSEAMPQHNTDAMEALRTLHTATAALPQQEHAVASIAEANIEPGAPSLTQTYSYKLRSEEPPAQHLTQKPSKPVAHRRLDSLSSAARPLDQDASVAAVDPKPQTGAIVLSDTELDVEQTQVSEQPTIALPESNAEAPTTPQAAAIARILHQLDEQALSAKAMLPNVGLLAQTLKPKLSLHLAARYQPIWLTDVSSKQPIHQFTPVPEASDFHSKLKSVAQVPEDQPEDKS